MFYSLLLHNSSKLWKKVLFFKKPQYSFKKSALKRFSTKHLMNAASIRTKAAVKNVCMAYDVWALINAITKL